MHSCIFLILGLLHVIYGASLLNVTKLENYPDSCPVALFRRKRANGDYTRWRSNLMTTPEFIVKVLDEDIPTTKVVAVNILTATKKVEKIIVGGAAVPPPQSAAELALAEAARDYTRFVPPTTTTLAIDEDDIVKPTPSRRYEGLQPKSVRQEPFVFAMKENKNAMRDESPPASPQFVPRGAQARQFAPIAPVSFSKKCPTPQVTPPYTEEAIKTGGLPTRTYSASEMMNPLRTTDPENVPIFVPYTHSDDEVTFHDDFAVSRTVDYASAPTRSTIVMDQGLSTGKTHDDYLPTKQYTDARRIIATESEQTSPKESDLSYQDMFQYNDDYKDTTSKKTSKEGSENYQLYNDDNELVERVSPAPTRSGKPKTSKDAEKDVDVDLYDEDKASNLSVSEKIAALDAEPSAEEVDRAKRKPYCSLLKYRPRNFRTPMYLHEIVQQLKKWAEDSPLAKLIDITDGNYTVMENPIYMIIVDDPSSGQIISAKQTVMVVAGIQGRDHHAVAAALYLLYQLLERSTAHTELLTKYRFWVIPVFNPDGYEYSMTFAHRREWMKNLRQNWDTCKGRESCKQCATHGLRCNIQPCYGVNLDRNFEYQWISPEELKAEHPCGSLYAGIRQLSEAETRALTNYLHEKRAPLYTFIAFKEGDILGVLYPYSHTKKKRAYDDIFRKRASRAAAAAFGISGRPYVAGQSSEFLPLYAGGIEDWVDGHLGIDNTYTIMMFRPTDSFNSKVIVERAVHEAYAAMDTLLLQSGETGSQAVITHQARTLNDQSSSHHIVASLAVVLLGSLTVLLCR